MPTGETHNCAGCGRRVPGEFGKGTSHCKACVRAARSDATPRWLAEPGTPALLRASTPRRGKDTQTLPMFDELAGTRPNIPDDSDKKRRRKKRKPVTRGTR